MTSTDDTEAARLRVKIDAYQAQAADFHPDDFKGIMRGLRAKLAAAEGKIIRDADTGPGSVTAVMADGTEHVITDDDDEIDQLPAWRIAQRVSRLPGVDYTLAESEGEAPRINVYRDGKLATQRVELGGDTR